MTDENGNVLKRQSHIICPQGFNIIEPIAKLTRITTERAQREGVDLYSVLTEFMEDVNDAKLLIAHNLDFDKRVVGCELYRENMDYDSLLNKSMVCTMQKSTNFSGLNVLAENNSTNLTPSILSCSLAYLAAITPPKE